ncbi:SNARE associated Golgi protein [Pseudohyphozyma bogoriensis]|nr:SNARE associated Golgi protein [Pseudohyphozyma bogoriensis]
MYLSILGGAMYGVLIALPLACFCVATGALLCYLISQQLGPAILLNSEKWQKRVEKWTERIAEHNDNLISYLIVLRIAPLPPHWVVNVVAPHLGISIWTFWISTFFGIMGVSFIHTQIGTTLDQMTSASDFHLISWQNGVGLGGIIIAVLIPVFMRRAWKKDLDQAAMDNDDASLLPVPNISITIPSSLPRLSMDRDHKIRLSYNSEEDLSKGYEEERDARARNFEIGGSDSEDDDAAESSNSGKGKERAVSPVYGGNGVAGGGDMKKASKLLGVDVGGPGRGGNEAGWGGR